MSTIYIFIHAIAAIVLILEWTIGDLEIIDLPSSQLENKLLTQQHTESYLSMNIDYQKIDELTDR